MTEEFDVAGLRAAVVAGQLQWHRHALERMLEPACRTGKKHNE